ncbi:hypothetical protein [Mycoplasma phocoenae]|uniref:Uncharacterized protein n=1 Tax=Mycoplasma phocoenae TaxID=754517 RepID=A0A858U2P7_9MOLU|nr:hypothetical protein [Mycoplasma phocoenae]QJG66750.1 hypothetical protein HGG69_00165 [Mycoplasma phocoenae]
MEIDFHPWNEYFKSDKKVLKQLKKIRVNDADSEFNQDINIIEGSFVAPLGVGYNKFNKATVSGLVSGFVQYLDSIKTNCSKFNVLLAHDGSNDQLKELLKDMGQVLINAGINVHLFLENEPVAKNFALYSLKQTKDINILFYFSRYTEKFNDYALSLFNTNGQQIGLNFIEKIFEFYKSLNIFEVKKSNDDFIYLKTDLLQKEFSNELTKLKIRSNDVQKLTFGVYTYNNSVNLVKKIFGSIDAPYILINKIRFINESTILLFKNKNVFKNSYIFVLNEDCTNVDVFACSYKNIYKKINIENLWFMYINFYSTMTQIMNKKPMFEKLKISDFSNVHFQKENTVFKQNIIKESLITKEKDEQLYLQINEDGKAYTNLENFNHYNSLITLTLFTEMMNYYATQNIDLVSKMNNNMETRNITPVESFAMDLDRSLLISLIDILQKSDSINDKLITKKYLMNNIKNTEQQFLIKCQFSSTEWMGLKFNKMSDELIVYLQNNQLSSQINVFKKYFHKIIKQISNKDN